MVLHPTRYGVVSKNYPTGIHYATLLGFIALPYCVLLHVPQYALPHCVFKGIGP